MEKCKYNPQEVRVYKSGVDPTELPPNYVTGYLEESETNKTDCRNLEVPKCTSLYVRGIKDRNLGSPARPPLSDYTKVVNVKIQNAIPRLMVHLRRRGSTES
ncbi:hypothetical protein RUM44_007660 [Polyplax serrata]|uniref:Uncharacterized protein n=1 Tax=Polyplax serrata TaxID=468196 RepID=A0ABR1B717_POLSC